MSFASFQKIIVRNVLRKYFETAAKLNNKAFVCKSLEGTGTYDFSINSDMTVSCNAQDYDGSGQLGNLNKSSLTEIINNEKSNYYRQMLRDSKLPNIVCSRCPQLRMVNKSEIAEKKHYEIPKDLFMIENTISCDMNCKSCERSQVLKHRSKKSLSLEDFKKIAKEIKKNGIKSICFFNLGEPFLSENIYKELKILKDENPDIEIIVSSNALHLDTDKKRMAAKYINHIAFSIDGVDSKMLRKYQSNGNFEKSYINMANLQKYVKRNGYKTIIEWKYILFNWNDKEKYLKKAVELAKEAKISKITFWPTKNPWYGISIRYYTSKFLKKGIKNEKGVIEVKIQDK